MGYAAAKTNTLLLMPANSNRLLTKLSLKPLRCTAQQALLTRIFLQVHWDHSPQPRGHRQARHTPFTSPTATPKPTSLLQKVQNKASGTYKARPDPSTVPPLEAKPADARSAGARNLTGDLRGARGPHPALRPRRPGAQPPSSSARSRPVTCSPAASGPNSGTKEAPRLQMAQEAEELSKAEPS